MIVRSQTLNPKPLNPKPETPSTSLRGSGSIRKSHKVLSCWEFRVLVQGSGFRLRGFTQGGGRGGGGGGGGLKSYKSIEGPSIQVAG